MSDDVACDLCRTLAWGSSALGIVLDIAAGDPIREPSRCQRRVIGGALESRTFDGYPHVTGMGRSEHNSAFIDQQVFQVTHQHLDRPNVGRLIDERD